MRKFKLLIITITLITLGDLAADRWGHTDPENTVRVPEKLMEPYFTPILIPTHKLLEDKPKEIVADHVAEKEAAKRKEAAKAEKERKEKEKLAKEQLEKDQLAATKQKEAEEAERLAAEQLAEQLLEEQLLEEQLLEESLAAEGAIIVEESQSSSLFAQIVHAETSDESYIGKVAVAEVILNRVRSSQFPNTVEEVVYQSGQFSPVSDGSINNTPTAEDYAAIAEAEAGSYYAQGALFFYNPDLAVARDLDAFTTITIIGGHHFK